MWLESKAFPPVRGADRQPTSCMRPKARERRSTVSTTASAVLTVTANPRRLVGERSDIMHADGKAPISSLVAASLAVAKVLESPTAAPVAVVKRAAQ